MNNWGQSKLKSWGISIGHTLDSLAICFTRNYRVERSIAKFKFTLPPVILTTVITQLLQRQQTPQPQPTSTISTPTTWVRQERLPGPVTIG
jgi:hypothetical protein